jgi:hypothetical protein
MLAEPVPVVDEVARGRRILGREILVATVARPQRPFVPVLVAAEARRHLGPESLGVLLRDGLVAAHAVPVGGDLMRAMLEAKMLPRNLSAFAYVGGAVAAEARARIVRLLVAPDAGGITRKVQSLVGTGARDPLVAVHAIDAVGRVRAMLERVSLVVSSETEHPRARRERERHQDDETEGELHSFSQLFDARSSALAS